MQKRTSFITKDQTYIIYGVALIFMFIHHFFTFPTWLVEGVSYPYLASFAKYFNSPFQICVPIFAFLSGYFYFFNPSKNLSYSLKKCSDIYISYILCFFLLFAISIATGSIEFNLKSFLMELFLLNNNNMTFCWYVFFYILMMLILPMYSKLANKSPFLALAIVIVFSQLLLFVSDWQNSIQNEVAKQLFKNICNLKWFSCVGAGYWFAQKDLFLELDVFKKKNALLRVLIYTLFMVIPFLFRYISCSYDFIVTPLFVFGLVSLVNMVPYKKGFIPISLIGKNSLYMWFLHCAFFNVSAKVTQPILFFPKNPILVLIWGLVMCLAVSIPINKLASIINNKKNGILFRRLNIR